jgi:CheY-like chemotaxis protein
MGHSSVVANNGREALALASSQKFDLVFMDVQMPEMDGLAATVAIRKAEKLTKSHLPIFAMTAHAMKGDRESCLQAGMDGYLAKPCDGTLVDSRWHRSAIHSCGENIYFLVRAVLGEGCPGVR